MMPQTIRPAIILNQEKLAQKNKNRTAGQSEF